MILLDSTSTKGSRKTLLQLTELKHTAGTVFGCDMSAVLSGGQRTAIGQSHGFEDWQLLAEVLSAVLVQSSKRVIAISGSQGSGKSTFATVLVAQLGRQGKRAVTLSLDDFYLPKSERRQLANEVHPLLQTRGVPGTHDSQWLAQVLDSFNSGSKTPLRLPKFDKGLDDRIDSITCDADILVLEGWCVGVVPQPRGLLIQPVNELEQVEDKDGVWRRWVNEQIQQHYLPLWSAIEFWLHIQVPNFEQVYQWRSQQELELPSAQRMSTQQLQRFIQHYERLTRWLWRSPAQAPGALIVLGGDHRVTQVTFSASDTAVW